MTTRVGPENKKTTCSPSLSTIEAIYCYTNQSVSVTQFYIPVLQSRAIRTKPGTMDAFPPFLPSQSGRGFIHNKILLLHAIRICVRFQGNALPRRPNGLGVPHFVCVARTPWWVRLFSCFTLVPRLFLLRVSPLYPALLFLFVFWSSLYESALPRLLPRLEHCGCCCRLYRRRWRAVHPRPRGLGVTRSPPGGSY